MKTLIISPTRHYIYADRPIDNSIVDKDTTISKCYNGEGIGLSKFYNQYIDDAITQIYDYIVFVHDDVKIDCGNLTNELTEAFKQFDIVGLAGGVHTKIQHPALWHIMCKREHQRGFVAHPHKVEDFFPEQIMVSNFGPSPSRVLLLDGLFIAINLKKILEVGWKFNENYDFHHYDIASCLDAHMKGLKMGVWPIFCAHSSPGLRSFEDPIWKASNEKFLAEYSEKVIKFNEQ